MIKNTLLPVAEFCQRRKTFIDQMPINSIALIAAGSEVTRSNDTEYPFCQNKHFYYLTGFNEPDAVLALIKGNDSTAAQSVLFSRKKDTLQEIWHGRRVGQVQAIDVYKFDNCFSLDEVDEQLLPLMVGKASVLICQHEQSDFQQKVLSWLAQLRKSARTGIKAPAALIDCSDIINEMRLNQMLNSILCAKLMLLVVLHINVLCNKLKSVNSNIK